MSEQNNKLDTTKHSMKLSLQAIATETNIEKAEFCVNQIVGKDILLDPIFLQILLTVNSQHYCKKIKRQSRNSVTIKIQMQ